MSLAELRKLGINVRKLWKHRGTYYLTLPPIVVETQFEPYKDEYWVELEVNYAEKGIVHLKQLFLLSDAVSVEDKEDG